MELSANEATPNQKVKFDIISKVPVEIAQIILQKLEGRDVLNASAVSRRWYAITNVNYLWKKRCQEENVQDVELEDKPARFRNFFAQFSTHWKAVYMRYMRIGCNWTHGNANFSFLKNAKGGRNAQVYHMDERVVITYHQDHHIYVWSIDTLKLMHTLTNTTPVASYAVHGNKIAASKLSKTVTIWNFLTAEVLLTLPLDDYVFNVHLTDRWIIASCANDLIHIYDASSGNEIGKFFGFSVTCLDYDFPNLIVSGFDDGALRIWNTESNRYDYILSEHYDKVYFVKFVGDYLISCSTDYQICVWNKANYTLRHAFQDNKLPIVLLKDNKIASYTTDELIKIWNIEDGRCLLTIYDDTANVKCITANQRYIVGSVTRGIRIWDMASGFKVRTLTICGDTTTIRSIKATETKLSFLRCSRYGNVANCLKRVNVIDFDI